MSGISGPVTVEQEGISIVRGVVDGGIENRGGRVEVHGVVNGPITMKGGTLVVSGVIDGASGDGMTGRPSRSILGGVPQR